MLKQRSLRPLLTPIQETGLQKVSAIGESSIGRRLSVISIALALASLAITPVILGPLGILMGVTAVAKGDRYLGMLGLTASAVFGVTGYYLAGALAK